MRRARRPRRARPPSWTPAPAPRRSRAPRRATRSASGAAAADTGKASGGTAAGSTGTAGTTGGAAAGQQSAQAAGGDKLTASPAAYQGWKTFHVYCYRCHGTDAMGSDLAPNLRHSVSPQGSVTREIFVTTVKEGRVPKGMPAWATVLSDEQIANLYAYVKARSDGSLAAGRPKQGN